MNNSTKFCLAIALLALLLLAVFLRSDQEVLIESLESKTSDAKPVYNKIDFTWAWDREIWMMNQSHYGQSAPAEKWDRLAIIVNKTTSPHTVHFYQLAPGALVWKAALPEHPFRVSCFMCHNNGPRAIRPNVDSSAARLGILSRLKINLWNVRLKLYGRLVPDTSHGLQDEAISATGKKADVPFRQSGDYPNEVLKVETCKRCHNDDNKSARGFLHRQQSSTIRFLIESGQMPPPENSLSEKEKVELGHFLLGF